MNLMVRYLIGHSLVLLQKRAVGVRPGTSMKEPNLYKAALLLAGAYLLLVACSAYSQEKEEELPYDKIRKLSPIKAPDSYIPLELMMFHDSWNPAEMVSNPWAMSACEDGSVIVLDQRNKEMIRIGLEKGDVLARWHVADSEDKIAHPLTVRANKAGRIYVPIARMRLVKVFDEDGKLIDTFKNINQISYQFRVAADGMLYSVPIGPMREGDDGSFISVFGSRGRLEQSFGSTASDEFPELHHSSFLAPLAGREEIVLLSRTFPIFQVYSKSGALRDEVRFQDERLDARVKTNMDNLAMLKKERSYPLPSFNWVEWWDDDLLIGLQTQDVGAEFLRVNLLGEVVCSYYYKPRGEDDAVRIRDFVVIETEVGPRIVGVSRKPWPQVVVFAPTEEPMPPPATGGTH